MIGALYFLILVFYSLSVLGYFIDFMQNNQKVNKAAFWLLSIVWGLQLVLFLLRYLLLDRLPLMTSLEGMFVYAWILVSVSLVLNRILKMNALMLFINAIGFILLAISMIAPAEDISPALASVLITEFLIVHVGLLLLSYAAFTISFVFSLLYIAQHKLLKKKKWGRWMDRFGTLSDLQRNAYFASLTGVPLLFTGLILGMIWASVTVGEIPWFDLKIVSSFLVLIVYGVFLVQYRIAGMRGYSLALLNTAAFLLLLINYFLSSVFSRFHIW
ncbi:cytochrome C assembly family protein [Alkalicoccus urumqiensis]|uniref:Cytochrome C assembly protein n=1 Tax=Alkalicoccus urumqiensis TaxID=1548213 RepID=A0A2P6MF98_ALKUR|nr:cytochrome c biogenesis protein CcsA [Alkalicoccus urumqiensis]PRO64921.1 cytochrome C assembly protein [Alkalicoccus urumqiensis]